jgi:CheY-like chemotaxis protein
MKNVLLVDDDVVFTFLNKKIIKSLDFINEIDIAQNGFQAIQLLQKYIQNSKPLPDIILLDLNMPIMDGFGFLQAFSSSAKCQNHNCNIIVTHRGCSTCEGLWSDKLHNETTPGRKVVG